MGVSVSTLRRVFGVGQLLAAIFGISQGTISRHPPEPVKAKEPEKPSKPYSRCFWQVMYELSKDPMPIVPSFIAPSGAPGPAFRADTPGEA